MANDSYDWLKKMIIKKSSLKIQWMIFKKTFAFDTCMFLSDTNCERLKNFYVAGFKISIELLLRRTLVQEVILLSFLNHRVTSAQRNTEIRRAIVFVVYYIWYNLFCEALYYIILGNDVVISFFIFCKHCTSFFCD